MRVILIILSLVFLAFCGCDSSKDDASTSSTPTPKPPALAVAESESDFQDDDDWEHKTRAEVRQVVSENVKTKLSSWTLKGISSESYQKNVYWVAVDVEKDKQSVIFDLVVRKFFPESGNPYWKVVLANTTLKEQLHRMNDADTWKKLNEAKSSLEETKNELENLKNPPYEDERGDNDPR